LFSLRTLCRTYFGFQALVIGAPEVDIGIKVLVDRPEEVGADRLVNAVGAFRDYGGPKIIVDFGTATTFDVIDAEGSYLGGVIAPGVNLSIEALHQASAQLPRVAIGRPDRVIGKNTLQAMRSGIFWGYLGMVEGTIRRIWQELGNEVDVISTGGLAPLFTECTSLLSRSDPDLTLKGLRYVYLRNAKQ
jgi:type III pantothenate kinase